MTVLRWGQEGMAVLMELWDGSRFRLKVVQVLINQNDD